MSKAFEAVRFTEIPEGRALSVPQARSAMRQEGSEAQAIVCAKDRFPNVAEARTWVGHHGYRTDKVDVTEDAFRFRQFEASECKEGETFATVTLDRGVKAIVCKRGTAPGEAEALRECFPDGEIRHADFPLKARTVTPSEVRESGYMRGDDEDKEKGYRLHEVAITSEAEIERWFGIEVLGHEPDEVDMTRMTRGAAVLVGHNRNDQVGVVAPGSARVDRDKVLRGYVRFSRSQRGREIEQDVDDGVRTSISAGYFVQSAKLVEVRQVGTDNAGRAITVDVYRATRWQPAEVSLVSVPADVTVGVGRSVEAGPKAVPSTGREPAEVKMKRVRENGKLVEVADDDPRPAARVVDAAERDKEIGEILEICDGNGIEPKLARSWIAEGLNVEEVSVRIVKERKSAGKAQPSAEALGAVPEKDRRRYRYGRAILKAAQQRDGTGKFDGLEAEVHQELNRQMDRDLPRHEGVFIPMDLRTEADRWREWERRQMQARALDSKTAGKGVETVFEEPGELIEILRQASVAMQLGARMLGGLTGPVAFPKHNGRLTAFWVGENPGADVTATDLGFGLVNMTPKTIQATTAYSRQLLVQSSVDTEGLVRSELSEEHALLWDRTLFHGEGAAGEPMGIYKAPDVRVRAVGGVPDLADVVDLIGAVADANALAGSLGWVTTPLMAAKLRQTPEHATAAPARWIWEGTFLAGEMAGYRALASNQISKTMTGSEDTGGTEHGAIFGNWREAVVGLFAAMEIIVDPFALKKRGMIEVTSFQMADHVLRHGESFGKWTGATTS